MRPFIVTVLGLSLALTLTGCGPNQTSQVTAPPAPNPVTTPSSSSVAEQVPKPPEPQKEKAQVPIREPRLKQKPARNAKELASIVEKVLQETGETEEAFVVGADKEVSTGGYWLSAEVKVKKSDKNTPMQLARYAVLAAYLNKGKVPLLKVSVNIISPVNPDMYGLQVAVGKSSISNKQLETLNKASITDFENWLKNNRTRETTGPKDYSDHLWVDGPLAQ